MASQSGMKMDAVLPLVRADYERAGILFASLDRYFDILGRLWVVVPDDDLEWMRRRIGARRDSKVIAESALIPELETVTRRPSGWSLQQLVKLAIADRVGTEFYLTLDADVICVQTVTGEELVMDGRAISNRRTGVPFREEWYDWAERVLGLPRSQYVHGVTPAVLSRRAVASLQRFLSMKDAPAAGPAALLARWRRKGWRRYLLDQLPWTEYTLYFSYLEAVDLYDDYHFPGEAGADTIYGNSIWLPGQTLDEWDAGAVFDQPVPYQFVVIQSNHPTITTADVWDKVDAYLGAASP